MREKINLPEMCGVDFGYDKTSIVPCWRGDSSEHTQDDYHKHFRVNDVEKKHRQGGHQQTECY